MLQKGKKQTKWLLYLEQGFKHLKAHARPAVSSVQMSHKISFLQNYQLMYFLIYFTFYFHKFQLLLFIFFLFQRVYCALNFFFTQLSSFFSSKAMTTPSCLLSIIFHSLSPSSSASAGRRQWPKPGQRRRSGSNAHVLMREAVSQHGHYGHHDGAAQEAAAHRRVAQGAEEAQVQPVGQQRHQPP